MTAIYETSRYEVIALKDTGENYGVRNKETGAVEYKHDVLPQCLGVCDQFTYILEEETWKAPSEGPHVSLVN